MYQIGAVLGVALYVAVVGTPTGEETAVAFDRGWIFAACAGVAAAALALALSPVRTVVRA